MTCKINKSLFDKIYQFVSEKKLDSILFYPYHKGIDVSINGILDKSEKKKVGDQLADLWFENNFIYRVLIEPKIYKSALELIGYFENDLSEFGSAKENWNFKELIETININFTDEIDSEFDFNDLALNLDGSGNPSIKLNYYELKYFKRGIDEGIDLTKNKVIKSKIVNYLENWSVKNLYNCSEKKSNYTIHISDSNLMELTELWSENFVIEIVEE